jgi:hypothetical protein
VGLQDIYKFATHEKGILGSQGEYNKRHRRMCQPPFRNPNLLRDFSDIVVDRAVDAAFCLQSAAERAEAAGGPLTTDISVHTQRLTLDIVGLTAFSHDFRQVRHPRPTP